MGTNAFGLPQSKKDKINRNTHLRTGTPHFLAPKEGAASSPVETEAQNLQNEAMQTIQRQQESGGTMTGY